MEYIIFVGQILLSGFLGGIVGWQRERVGKAAGLRTYALVSLGSTLLTLLSLYGFPGTPDTSRIASQILTGVGFIGAGTIIHREGGVEGLTTAAGLWAVAAVGIAIGVGWYWQGLFTTLVMMTVLLFQNKTFFKR